MFETQRGGGRGEFLATHIAIFRFFPQTPDLRPSSAHITHNPALRHLLAGSWKQTPARTIAVALGGGHSDVTSPIGCIGRKLISSGLCPANRPAFSYSKTLGEPIWDSRTVVGCYSWKERRDSLKGSTFSFPAHPTVQVCEGRTVRNTALSVHHYPNGCLAYQPVLSLYISAHHLPKAVPARPPWPSLQQVFPVYLPSSPAALTPANQSFPYINLLPAPHTALNHRFSLLQVSLLHVKCVFKFPINIPTYVNMSCFYYFKIMLLLNDTHLLFHSNL